MVYQLGTATILAALFGTLPAALEIARCCQDGDVSGMPNWAWLLILASGVQVAFAVFAMQVPDWGTVRVLSVFGLGLSAIYAMALGVTLLGDPSNDLVRLLGLSARVRQPSVRGWCLILLCASLLLAYASGRTAARWHRAFQTLVGVPGRGR